MSDPKAVVPEESGGQKNKGLHDPDEINPKLASDIHLSGDNYFYPRAS